MGGAARPSSECKLGAPKIAPPAEIFVSNPATAINDMSRPLPQWMNSVYSTEPPRRQGLSLRPSPSYAFLIAYLTFDFLALRAYRESLDTSVHRVLMIVAGAMISFLVSMLPTSGSSARAPGAPTRSAPC